MGEIEQAAAKDPEKLDEAFLARRLRNIERMAPDMMGVILVTLAKPWAGQIGQPGDLQGWAFMVRQMEAGASGEGDSGRANRAWMGKQRLMGGITP